MCSRLRGSPLPQPVRPQPHAGARSTVHAEGNVVCRLDRTSAVNLQPACGRGAAGYVGSYQRMVGSYPRASPSSS